MPQESKEIGSLEEMVASISDDITTDELRPPQLAKVAAVQCIHVGILNLWQHVAAVDQLEAIYFFKLVKDADYAKELKDFQKVVIDKGKLYAESDIGQSQLAAAKFKAIMNFLYRDKTDDVELKT